MKAFIFVCLAVLAVVSATYSDKYDDFDVDEAMKNCRLFEPYVKCVLEKSTQCTPEGKELKKNLDDALKDDCGKCTQKQKEKAEHVIGLLICKYFDTTWKELVALYDSEGKYTHKHADKIEETKKKCEKYNAYPVCNV